MVNQAITESQLDHAIFVVVGDLAKIQDDITTAVPAQWAVVSATEEE